MLCLMLNKEPPRNKEPKYIYIYFSQTSYVCVASLHEYLCLSSAVYLQSNISHRPGCVHNLY